MPKKLTPRQKAGRKNRKKRGLITQEGRERLRQSARDNRPWRHSTGPRTAAGKARSRRNAYRHGGRSWELVPPGLRAVHLGLADGGLPHRGLTAAVLLKMEKLEPSVPMLLRCSRLFERHRERWLRGFAARYGLEVMD